MRRATTRIALVCGAVALATFCVGWYLFSPRRATVSFVADSGLKQDGSPTQDTHTSTAHSAGTLISGVFLLFHGEYFKVVARNTVAGDAVQIVFTEEVPENFAEASVPSAPTTTPGRHQAVFQTEVAFMPQRYASRGANDLFLAGPPWTSETADPDSDGLGTGTVVERWTITAPLGAPYTIRTSSTAPIGTPAPLSTLSAQIPGGVYIPAEQRGPARVRKSMLGYFAFSIDGIDVDPEGRFLLMVSAAEAKLYRLDLAAYDGNPVVILDVTVQPALAFADGMSFSRFQDGLKKCVINCSNGHQLVLHDDENDGLFESWELLTDAQYFSHPLYGNYSGMAENYRTYDVIGLFQ